MTDEALLSALPGLLLPWFSAHRRELPWRADREPYHVWLSEIMLQQTRVEAVRDYYLRFLRALPTVEALASADEGLLLKLWEGLGYYTRVRNLQRAAQEIVRRGAFPRDHAEVLSLPGIGAYTADGAAASEQLGRFSVRRVRFGTCCVGCETCCIRSARLSQCNPHRKEPSSYLLPRPLPRSWQFLVKYSPYANTINRICRVNTARTH